MRSLRKSRSPYWKVRLFKFHENNYCNVRNLEHFMEDNNVSLDLGGLTSNTISDQLIFIGSNILNTFLWIKTTHVCQIALFGMFKNQKLPLNKREKGKTCFVEVLFVCWGLSGDFELWTWLADVKWKASADKKNYNKTSLAFFSPVQRYLGQGIFKTKSYSSAKLLKPSCLTG